MEEAMAVDVIGQEALRRVLHYCPETGEFTWLVKASFRIPAGSKAGGTNSEGYVLINVQGRRYSAHRLAFIYMTGELPKQQVDHINGNRADNRWANLREVSHLENTRNLRKPKTNTSGIVGVGWVPGIRRWQAKIGRRGNLGTYDNLLDAVCARRSAEIALGFHPSHGRKE